MKLCLNAIVKNEASRIIRCLESVADHVVDYAIVDTGSTDDTERLIFDFFAARGVHGILISAPFIDFATSRNRALELCRSTIGGRAEYVLLMDADMQMVIDREPELTAPAYALIQRGGMLTYWNTRLVRRDCLPSVRYRGVTHEYLETPGVEPARTHDVWFIDHADGANRPGKSERDIELLEKGLREEPDENLKTRYYFYLGQTLQSVGRHDEAIAALEERVRRGGWEEEVFYAAYQIAQCFKAQGREREFLGSVIQAFKRRPTRGEPLYLAANYFREREDSHEARETSLLFSRTGITLPRPDDILFVDDFIHLAGLREEFEIAGYFSRDPETRAKAHAICEAMALDRLIPAASRDLARRNLFWFAPKLKSLAPSWEAKQIEGFTAPKGWRAMNPSICRFGDKLMAVIRCVNYWIEPDGSYKFPDSEPAVITRNFLAEMDLENPHIVKRTISEIVADLGTMWWGNVRGMEDLRLFTTQPIPNGLRLWFSCACRQMNPEGMCEQLIGKLDLDGLVQDLYPMRLNTGRYEKNWMPLIDAEAPTFVYRVDPTTIVTAGMDALPEGQPTQIAGDNFAGSSQLIRFDGGWLAMEHEPLASPINGRRLNQQRFIWFTKDLELAAISKRFIFELNEEIEYVMGLVDQPGDFGGCSQRLIISYGSHDRQAWVGTIDADDVRKMLSKAEAPSDNLPIQKVESTGGPLAPNSSFSVISPENLAWVNANTNAALQTVHDVDYAGMATKAMGLMLGNPVTKSWDNYLAVFYALGTVKPDSANWIIDAGGSEESVFLPALKKLGFKKLANINLDRETVKELARRHPDSKILSYIDDLERIECFSTGEVAYMACLSVIEHGVDWRKFLRRASEVIQPGGHLFLSFDYWESVLDTTVKIFERGEVENLIGFADAVGLILTSPFRWECADRVVSWAGREYTFANLLFRKDASGSDGSKPVSEGDEMITPSDLEEQQVLMARGLDESLRQTAEAVGHEPARRESFPPDWDALSLDRSVSRETREGARRSSVVELRRIDELFSSWQARRLTFAAPEGFNAMATSVINRKGRLLASVRCINYRPGDESEYYRISDGAMMGGAVRPKSRAFMVELDPVTLEDRTLAEISTSGALPRPRADARTQGLEDLRPFEWGEKLWAVASFSEQSHDGLPEQWLVRFNEDVWSVDLTKNVSSQAGPRRAEKNWMPIIASSLTPRFIYLCDPTTIIDYRGEVLHRSEPAIAAEHFHGGSQAVPFDGGWLAMVHWMQVMDEANRWVDLKYRNRFVWLDKNFDLKRVSPVWEFPIDPAIPSFPARFQIAHGLAWHPDRQRLVMSYAMYEREPWVATISADDVCKVLK